MEIDTTASAAPVPDGRATFDARADAGVVRSGHDDLASRRQIGLDPLATSQLNACSA